MAAKAQAEQKVQTSEIDTSDWNDANISIDGWYAPEISKQIVGRAVEAIRVTSSFGEQDVVKIRLGAPATAITGKGDDAEHVQLEKGDVLAVRISANLTVLLDLVANQCAVQITPTGKSKTKAGRNILLYNVKFKGEKKPLASLPRVQEQSGGASDAQGDDGVPF